MRVARCTRAAKIFLLIFGSITFATPARAEQFTDAWFCQFMKEAADKSYKDVGSKVDSVTINLGMGVLCNMKVVNYKKRLEVPFSAFNAGWEQRKQAQWNQIYCNNVGFAEAIASGWTISVTTIDADGKQHYMDAKCR